MSAEPLADIAEERDAIFGALPSDLHVLVYHGGEPAVALVQREQPPSTEYPIDGERVVLIEWEAGGDYAISLAEADERGWKLTDELVSTHDNRAEAIWAASDAFNDD